MWNKVIKICCWLSPLRRPIWLVAGCWLVVTEAFAAPPINYAEFSSCTFTNTMIKPKGVFSSDATDTSVVLCCFFDDFSSYQEGVDPKNVGGSKWIGPTGTCVSPNGATWYVTNGSLYQSLLPSGRIPGRGAGIELTDALIEFKFKPVAIYGGDGDCKMIAVLLRSEMTNGGAGYAVCSGCGGRKSSYSVRYSGAGSADVYVKTDTSGYTAGGSAITEWRDSLNQWYDIKVVIEGYRVQGYWNGIKYADWTDPKQYWKSGYFSIMERGCQAYHDDFKIYSPTKYLPSGTLLSKIEDYNHTTGSNRFTWSANMPTGTQFFFQTRSADNPADLERINWDNCTRYTVSGSSIGSLKRYVQYRITFLSNSGGSAAPQLYSVKIEPSPLQRVVLNPTPAKLGTLDFELYFSEPMSTVSPNTPTIVFTPDGGTPITVTGGQWTGNTYFKASYNIIVTIGGGPASLQISNAKTVADAYTMPAFSDNNILYIDSGELIDSDKLQFFPDPFSPNGDGKADTARIVNLLPLDSSAKVSVRIYNLKGKLVRTLFEGECIGMPSFPAWDGTDESGAVCPIGIYLFQLITGTTSKTSTVTLVK